MPFNVPDAPKVYSKTYENFKGCDYTNDSTNVWYRRSPSGVNMLPDASGRPFKRKGWESVISADDLLAKFAEEEIEIEETSIQRCFYFELAGVDHIIIFAIGGVFKYANDILSFLDGSDDVDCYSSYDRAFFFEGDGTSAFYIYGNHKVWRYDYVDETFRFQTVAPYVPRVLISTSADCTGTQYEAYNMLSNKEIVEYVSNDLFFYVTSGDISITVDKTKFSTRGKYIFTYDGTNWKYNGEVVDITTTYGITIVIGTPEEDDTITVVYSYGVLLPQNVSQQQVSMCSAFITKVTQFDYELDVKGNNYSPSTTQCVLHTDETSKPVSDRKAWVEFNADYSSTSQEDTIKIILPSTEVVIDNYDDEVGGGTANVMGKKV